MKNVKALFSLVLLLVAVGTLAGQEQTAKAQLALSAAEAKSHIGQEATVCGLVVDTRYASSSRGRPTFLNLEKPYPNQVFTVVIWGEYRERFGKPEIKYRDKRICVTGKISSYRSVPQIQVIDPKQIQVKEE